jgi:hypothetical protein
MNTEYSTIAIVMMTSWMTICVVMTLDTSTVTIVTAQRIGKKWSVKINGDGPCNQ